MRRAKIRPRCARLQTATDAYVAWSGVRRRAIAVACTVVGTAVVASLGCDSHSGGSPFTPLDARVGTGNAGAGTTPQDGLVLGATGVAGAEGMAGGASLDGAGGSGTGMPENGAGGASPTGSVAGGTSVGGDGAAGSTPSLDEPQPFEGTNSGLHFSATRGVMSEPFDLVMTHDTASELRYTLDGSDPRTSPSVITAALPATIRIDPDDTTGRFVSPAVIVRATASGVDGPPGGVATHTYLFLDRVVDLSPDRTSPGGGWPEQNDEHSGQYMDYGLDRDVTNSGDYSSDIAAAFRALPSLSLVTDLSSLFDPESGIYNHADQRGVEWERFASLELIHPDGAAGFQANCGVRIRGGFSRNESNPKHAFRIFFRGTEYGTTKLRFPIFGSEGVARFDRLDLRTSQNYSWSFEGDLTDEHTMVREVFSRDLQRDLGQPYTRSRYYHLYLDGVYWGLFQSQERAESNFAADYLGGNGDDYDVVKANRESGSHITIEASDGTLDTWQAVWTLTQTGFEADEVYFELQGLGADGTRDQNRPVLVDVDNLIDYMLVIFYTANFDAPTTKFLENKQPNNFYTLTNRVDASRGFVFFAHDNEHTLMGDAVRVTAGVSENRASIGEVGGAMDSGGNYASAYEMNVTEIERFHPQWLHHRLTANAKYRDRFAARARLVLADGGPLSEEANRQRFDARASELDLAIIAESARWGDAQTPDSPRTRNEHWIPTLERARNGFIALRTPIVIEQLTALGLY